MDLVEHVQLAASLQPGRGARELHARRVLLADGQAARVGAPTELRATAALRAPALLLHLDRAAADARRAPQVVHRPGAADLPGPAHSGLLRGGATLLRLAGEGAHQHHRARRDSRLPQPRVLHRRCPRSYYIIGSELAKPVLQAKVSWQTSSGRR